MYSFKKKMTPWEKPIKISTGCSGNSVDPWIEIDSQNNIHIIWLDNSNINDNGRDYDIFYKTKSYSMEWSPISVVTIDSIANCKWPSMVISPSDTIHIAWSDITIGSSDYDIFHMQKKTEENWETPQKVTTESKYESNWPRFTVDINETIHMTWWDKTPERWISYYKEGTYKKTLEDTVTPSFTSSFFIICLIFITVLFSIKKEDKQ